MAEDNADHSNKSLWIIIVCAGVVVIGAAIALLLKNRAVPVAEPDRHAIKIVSTPEPSETSDSKTQPLPSAPKDVPSTGETDASKASEQPVVDYGKLKDNKAFQALMDQRKEKYGFEKGVDLIVKPDESIKVGDEVVPMQEILEKIRLKRGEVIEKDIADSTEAGTPTPKDSESRELPPEQLEDIEKLLKASDRKESSSEETKEEKVEQVASAYQKYKTTEEKIKQKKKLLADLKVKKESLISPKPLAGVPGVQSIPLKKVPESKPQGHTPKTTGKPESYIPIKPGVKQAAPEPESGEKKEIIAALPITQKPSVPKATDTAPVTGSRETVGSGTSKKSVPESKTLQPAPDIKDSGSGEIIVQKPAPSEKELAVVEEHMKSVQDEINTLLLQQADLVSEIRQLLTMKKEVEAYGIYVVQRGDNIWDVHFAFLTEYFTGRGVKLSRTADEPNTGGKSSGVGKILKFSENMVYIYNIRDHRLEKNINMIHPLSKIVVFNMGQVFEILDRLTYGDIEKIEFDGDNLWLPAES